MFKISLKNIDRSNYISRDYCRRESQYLRSFEGVLVGYTVAMVTYCVTGMMTTCSPMIGQFFDNMIVASKDKQWL